MLLVFWSCPIICILVIIYKTTNLINGKIYIGKDSKLRSTYLGSGIILRRAIAKYGKENFKKEILERCSSIEQLNEKEKYWIYKLNSNNKDIGYNLTEGGDGGNTYTFLSIDRKKRRREELKLAAQQFNSSEEGKKFLSENSKKMWRNENHRALISKMMTGREIKWADKISNSIKEWHKTNPITEDGKRRMRESGKQRLGTELIKISDELKQEIISLYQKIGPVSISKYLNEKGYNLSRFVIIRFLKKEGIYKKWQKGIGDVSQKPSSILMRGQNNPMFKNA